MKLILMLLGVLALAATAQPGGLDARLAGYAYPFPVRVHAFESQGQALEMAYMDVAPQHPNGRTVLLLHGKNMSGAYWKPTIQALTQRGFRVVAPDQVGFGKSSKPDGFQFTFQELATDTKLLLDSLGVKQAVVVGHSMGGMLATRFALMFPERVERLVLVNPIGLEDWKRVVPYATVDELYREELKQTVEGLRKYMSENYFGGEWKPEYDSLLEIHRGWMQGPDQEIIARIAARTSDMCFTQPVCYEFAQLKMPVLLLIGARDRTALGKSRAAPEQKARLGNYPALARQTQAQIPGSQLVLLPQSGHVPQMDDWPAYLKALTGFLTE